MYIWLLGFYCIFHLWLNILAELTRFGDRHFYRDWWNARNLDYFWRNWNMPVHHWLKRHVYNPLMLKEVQPVVAIGIVFLISAIGHELLVIVPLGILPSLPLAFLAMIVQLPLCIITRNIFRKSEFGNVVFWVSIILGQPFAVVMYHYDFVKRNFYLKTVK
eukprot:GSMAST32.ASY1.ANO1.1713.1 assembled CDS